MAESETDDLTEVLELEDDLPAEPVEEIAESEDDAPQADAAPVAEAKTEAPAEEDDDPYKDLTPELRRIGELLSDPNPHVAAAGKAALEAYERETGLAPKAEVVPVPGAPADDLDTVVEQEHEFVMAVHELTTNHSATASEIAAIEKQAAELRADYYYEQNPEARPNLEDRHREPSPLALKMIKREYEKLNEKAAELITKKQTMEKQGELLNVIDQTVARFPAELKAYRKPYAQLVFHGQIDPLAPIRTQLATLKNRLPSMGYAVKPPTAKTKADPAVIERLRKNMVGVKLASGGQAKAAPKNGAAKTNGHRHDAMHARLLKSIETG